MSELAQHSTREIVTDRLGAEWAAFEGVGLRSLGHNPSWVKVVDVERVLAEKDAQLAALIEAHERLVAAADGAVEYLRLWSPSPIGAALEHRQVIDRLTATLAASPPSPTHENKA